MGSGAQQAQWSRWFIVGLYFVTAALWICAALMRQNAWMLAFVALYLSVGLIYAFKKVQ